MNSTRRVIRSRIGVCRIPEPLTPPRRSLSTFPHGLDQRNGLDILRNIRQKHRIEVRKNQRILKQRNNSHATRGFRSTAALLNEPEAAVEKPVAEESEEPVQYSTPELTADAAAHKEALSDPDRPQWQNPLHHVQHDDRTFEEDFDSPEEFEAAKVAAPTISDDPIPDYIDALADEMVNLTVLEMNELINKMTLHYGFSTTMMNAGDGTVGAGGGGAAEEEVQEEKTAFDVKLVSFDAKSKIKIIKEVRSIAGLGLKEAKEWVEGVPKVIQKDVKMEDAEAVKAKLEELGATVEIS